MDISYKNGSSRFNYRVSCVVANNGKVLLHRNKKDDYWILVGGRVKVLESSEEALVREIKEELGETIKVDRLLCFTENFFNLNNEDFHELLIIFLANFEQGSKILDYKTEFEGIEEDKSFIYKWFDIDEVEALNIKPEFLKKMLIEPGIQQVHIVNRD